MPFPEQYALQIEPDDDAISLHAYGGAIGYIVHTIDILAQFWIPHILSLIVTRRGPMIVKSSRSCFEASRLSAVQDTERDCLPSSWTFRKLSAVSFRRFPNDQSSSACELPVSGALVHPTIHTICASRDLSAEPVIYPGTQGKSCTISAPYQIFV